MPRGNGRKNHSVNKERSHAARRKHRLWLVAREAQKKRRRLFLAAARAYWRGEAYEHP